MAVDTTKTHDSNGTAEYSDEAMNELISQIDKNANESFIKSVNIPGSSYTNIFSVSDHKMFVAGGGYVLEYTIFDTSNNYTGSGFCYFVLDGSKLITKGYFVDHSTELFTNVTTSREFMQIRNSSTFSRVAKFTVTRIG